MAKVFASKKITTKDGNVFYELTLVHNNQVGFITNKTPKEVNEEVELEVTVGYDHKFRASIVNAI